MRSSSAKLAGSSGLVTKALWPPLNRKMSPSKGRFSIAARSSRIWAGVGTSQPYSMSFLPGEAGDAAPTNIGMAHTADKTNTGIQGRRCASRGMTVGRCLRSDVTSGKSKMSEIKCMSDH